MATLAAVKATRLKPPLALRLRSTENPISFELLSFQVSLIELLERAVATAEEGADSAAASAVVKVPRTSANRKAMRFIFGDPFVRPGESGLAPPRLRNAVRSGPELMAGGSPTSGASTSVIPEARVTYKL